MEDNNNSIQNLKKIYTSTIGKISSLKQKKYSALQEFITNSSEIYLNADIDEINKKLENEENTLKTKVYEINILKQEQLEQLKNINNICSKEIEDVFNKLEQYKEINICFKKLESCENQIKEFNRILENRKFQYFMADEKKELLEIINEKEQLLEQISEIIPNFKIDEMELQKQKYNEETIRTLKQQKKDLKEYASLNVKIQSVLEEKLDDELLILNTVQMARRKRIIKEIKKNLNTQSEQKIESTILTDEELNEMQNLAQQFRKNNKPKKESEILTDEELNEMQNLAQQFNKRNEPQKESEILTDEELNQMKHAQEAYIQKQQQEKLSKKKKEKVQQFMEEHKSIVNSEVSIDSENNHDIENDSEVLIEQKTEEPTEQVIEETPKTDDIEQSIKSNELEQPKKELRGVNKFFKKPTEQAIEEKPIIEDKEQSIESNEIEQPEVKNNKATDIIDTNESIDLKGVNRFFKQPTEQVEKSNQTIIKQDMQQFMKEYEASKQSDKNISSFNRTDINNDQKDNRFINQVSKNQSIEQSNKPIRILPRLDNNKQNNLKNQSNSMNQYASTNSGIISKEVPIQAKISRQVPINNTQRIKEKIISRLNERLGIEDSVIKNK